MVKKVYKKTLTDADLKATRPDATPESIKAEQEQYDQEAARIREGTP